jgi:hypothetical protein
MAKKKKSLIHLIKLYEEFQVTVTFKTDEVKHILVY